MTSPLRSLRGGKRVWQKPSHSRLLQDVSMAPVPVNRSRRSRIDAIIVPATRPASWFSGLIDLSARAGTLLVVLCSMQARVERLAERVADTPAARALVIEVPADPHPEIPKWTSEGAFRAASAGRMSDLSFKRNLGLMLARLHGWLKIVFLDDDITLTRTDSFARLAGQLENHQFAGMVCRDYPDNSVVCHARRLAKLRQDNFISGAVLGVNCGDLPLPFFPDIYNEDWFSFSKAAARRDLPKVGEALQAEYDPFASPLRACHEEFGDLLAEGLYLLIGSEDPEMKFDRILRGATRQFWSDFIEARNENLDATHHRLEHFAGGGSNDGDDVAHRAMRSLAAAKDQLGKISPDTCTAFLKAWQEDMDDWERFCRGLNAVGSTREAMDVLSIKNWRLARFGNPDVGW